MNIDDKILSYVKKRNKISVPQIQKQFGLKYSRARAIVESFVDAGCLQYDDGIFYIRRKDCDKDAFVKSRKFQVHLGSRRNSIDEDEDDEDFDDEIDEDLFDFDNLFNDDDEKDEDDEKDFHFFNMSAGARDLVYDLIRSSPSTTKDTMTTKLKVFVSMNDDRRRAMFYPEVLDWLANYGDVEFERIKKLTLHI